MAPKTFPVSETRARIVTETFACALYYVRLINNVEYRKKKKIPPVSDLHVCIHACIFIYFFTVFRLIQWLQQTTPLPIAVTLQVIYKSISSRLLSFGSWTKFKDILFQLFSLYFYYRCCYPLVVSYYTPNLFLNCCNYIYIYIYRRNLTNGNIEPL